MCFRFSVPSTFVPSVSVITKSIPFHQTFCWYRDPHFLIYFFCSTTFSLPLATVLPQFETSFPPSPWPYGRMTEKNCQILLCFSSFPYLLGFPPPHFLESILGSCRRTISLFPSFLSKYHSLGCSFQSMHASISYAYFRLTRWQTVFSLRSSLASTPTDPLLPNLRLGLARTSSFSFSMENCNLCLSTLYVWLQLVCILLASLNFLEFPALPLSYSLFRFSCCQEKEVPFGTIRW